MELRREVVLARRRWLRWLAPPATLVFAAPFLMLGMTARALVEPRRVVVVAPAAPVCRPAVIHSTVAQSVAERWMDEPAELARQVRIVPSLTHGRPRGFKLYAIRPDSPLALMGLRNGDLLLRIDGVDPMERRADREIYQRVLDLSVVLEIERQGCPVTIVASAG